MCTEGLLIVVVVLFQMYYHFIELSVDLIYRANMSKRKGGDIRHYFGAKKKNRKK